MYVYVCIIYVCMYVCMYVYMYVCICICMYDVCMHVSMYFHVKCMYALYNFRLSMLVVCVCMYFRCMYVCMYVSYLNLTSAFCFFSDLDSKETSDSNCVTMSASSLPRVMLSKMRSRRCQITFRVAYVLRACEVLVCM